MDADAIVIGAGAAGLAAARSLAGRFARVVLLEARGRVGGRVWSRRVTRCATPAELGAEFIHGPANETMRLLREAGSAAVDTAGESWARSRSGSLRRDEGDFVAAAGIFEGVRNLANDESVDDYLRRFQGDASMREVAEKARAFVEGFDAADPAVASARAIADEWQSGVDFSIARPLGGYAPLFEYLRDACAADGVILSLSTIVHRVRWRRGAVTVDARDAAGTAIAVRAPVAIVTVPVGVLRHSGDETAVLFDPELPRAKRDALERIEMGHVVKIVLWFRNAFWERICNERYREGAFFRVKGDPFPAFWTQLPVRSELIVAWAGGPHASSLRGLTHAELLDRARRSFGAIFGDPAPARDAFEGGVTHDWWGDPFARGAYSYVRVGGADARAVLAAPVDETLFFAGEATSSDGQSGTVNGALVSGERAAAEVARA